MRPGRTRSGAPKRIFRCTQTLPPYEPMVVVEGLGTGIIEDTLVITESGHRLLTNAARDMGPS